MTGWDASPSGLLVLDPDGTVRQANGAVRRWTGRDDVVGVRLPDLLSVGGRIYWETHLGPLLHVERRLDEVLVELRGPDGRLPVLLTAVVGDDGAVHAALSSARERARFERELVAARHAAERSEAQLRALQGTTAALSRALGPDAVLDALLDAAVGALGAAAATAFAADGDALSVHGARHEDPAPLPAGPVLSRAPRADGDRVLVPLHGSAALRGVLSVKPRDDAGAEPLDLDVLDAVGAQAGLALDRAQLHAQTASVAAELQHSLLDVTPPSDARFSVAAVYRPGVEALEVGGDFYDVFLVDEGVLAVVVGDVVGRGLQAASAMGQLRSAVRALAAPGTGPAELLSRLDRFVDQVEAAGMATLAYAELELATGVLRYACAGHPPPLLLAGAAAPRLLWEGRSTPLGALLGRGRRTESVEQLPPGARLLLCTDGLFERRDRSLDEGLELLTGVAAEVATAPLGEAVRSLTSRMLADERGRDDVCVLLVQWVGGVLERPVRDVDDLAVARGDLSVWLRARGAVPAVAEEVVLAASEALVNALQHSGPGVRLRAETTPGPEGDQVVVTVLDAGRWRPAAADPERGRGLQIIGALVDDVVLEAGSGTTVVLRRRLEERAS
ncbi:MAG TPA: SpoIIE family protein phosphatase [Mycobacteriales bacterium]|nr:SpoIIE family protein phosphatase [Mycobacteriales bacterium]